MGVLGCKPFLIVCSEAYLHWLKLQSAQDLQKRDRSVH